MRKYNIFLRLLVSFIMYGEVTSLYALSGMGG